MMCFFIDNQKVNEMLSDVRTLIMQKNLNPPSKTANLKLKIFRQSADVQ